MRGSGLRFIAEAEVGDFSTVSSRESFFLACVAVLKLGMLGS